MIAAATKRTKATSGGVEEAVKDVDSFGRKKKTAANDDIPSDVAGESLPSSLTTADLTMQTMTFLRTLPGNLSLRL